MSDDFVMRGFGGPAVRVAPPPRGTRTAEVWAGIDPGKEGYIVAILPGATKLLASWPVPVSPEGDYDLDGVVRVARELLSLGPSFVMLERQQPSYPRPGQKLAANTLVKASFMIGYGFALWEMALTWSGVKFDTVMPGVWKKRMGLTAPSDVKDPDARRKLAKENAVKMALQVWSGQNFVPERCRVPRHDWCEASLLAEYGRLHHGR